MTTREEKIYKIYEVISDKISLFWQKIIYKKWPWHYCNTQIISKNFKDNDYLVKHEYNYFHPRRIKESDIIKRFWQPVLIWDIFNWTWWNIYSCQDCWSVSRNAEIFQLWEYKNKPIEEQSDECIDYIYNLLDNE